MGVMHTVPPPSNITVTSRGLDGVDVTVVSARLNRWAVLITRAHTAAPSAFHVGAWGGAAVALLYGWSHSDVADPFDLALDTWLFAGLGMWLLAGLAYALVERVLRERSHRPVTWAVQLDNTCVRVPHLGLNLRYSDIFRVSDRAEVRYADGRIIALAAGESPETQHWLARTIRETAAAHTAGSPRDVPAALRAARKRGATRR